MTIPIFVFCSRDFWVHLWAELETDRTDRPKEPNLEETDRTDRMPPWFESLLTTGGKPKAG